MTQKWINFRLLKSQLSFERVLSHYGIKTTKSGSGQVKCRCPFHDDKRASMGINLQQKIFQCFACKASGNILDFITRMEGYDTEEPGAVRKGAEVAAELMGVDLETHKSDKPSQQISAKPKQRAEKVKPASPSVAKTEPVDDGLENKPLTFELKLDPSHAWLKSQGLKRATLDAFGIGHCKRGLMKNRVCLPLRNVVGELVGYAGVWVSNDRPDNTPEWLFPTQFNLDRFVFGLDRIVGDIEEVIICPDYWSVLHCFEASIPALAIWQYDLSQDHIDQLMATNINRVSLLQQTDPELCAAYDVTLKNLTQHFYAKTVKMETLLTQTDTELVA